jgi:hypothetical protein
VQDHRRSGVATRRVSTRKAGVGPKALYREGYIALSSAFLKMLGDGTRSNHLQAPKPIRAFDKGCPAETASLGQVAEIGIRPAILTPLSRGIGVQNLNADRQKSRRKDVRAVPKKETSA